MNHLLAFILVFSTCIGFCQHHDVSQKDSLNALSLDEVIITATRMPQRLTLSPLPSKIISRKNIDRVNSVRLDEILNEQTGLITVTDFGGGEGIQLQGLDAEHVLILIDGVPLVGRQAGTLDINRITIGNIQQIEVIKGASSSLYGSEALGGVINIITANPQDGYKGMVSYRYGTFKRQDISTQLSYKNKTISTDFFANRYSSNGYDLIATDDIKTVNPFYNYTFNTKLIYRHSTKTTVHVSGRYYIQNQDNTSSSTRNGKGTIREWNIQTRLQHQYNTKWASHLELYTTRYLAKAVTTDQNGLLSDTSHFNQFLILPELRTTYVPDKSHRFIGGVGWRHEQLNRTSFFGTPGINSPYLYLQYDGNPTKKLNIIVGTRFDHYRQYKSQLSPKMAVRYQISDKAAVKGAVGYGFKAPDFRQLYFDFTNTTSGYTVLGYHAVIPRLPELESQELLTNIVIPLSEFENDLKPEHSISLNLGIQYTPFSLLSFDLNFFRNHIRNLIDTRVIANRTNGQNIFSYYNANQVYTQGLEYNFTWRPSKTIKITGGYQLLYAKDKTAEKAFRDYKVYAKNPVTMQTLLLKKNHYFGLYNRSRHMANLKLFYNVPPWNTTTNIRITYRSKYGITDSNSNGYLDSFDAFVNDYFIVNWAINKAFYSRYKLSLGIDNLFDFTNAPFIGNIPGRLFYGKMNINF